MANHTEEPLHDAARRACAYLEVIQERKVAPDPAAVGRLSALEVPLPDGTVPGAQTIEILDRVVAPTTLGIAGPRFFGFVIGGALPVTVAASWMATAWDQNTGYDASTPGVSRLEQV